MFTCNICENTFTSKYKLNNHKNICKKKRVESTSHNTDNKNDTKDTDIHDIYMNNENNKYYRCTVCNSLLDIKNEYKYHKEVCISPPTENDEAYKIIEENDDYIMIKMKEIEIDSKSFCISNIKNHDFDIFNSDKVKNLETLEDNLEKHDILNSIYNIMENRIHILISKPIHIIAMSTTIKIEKKLKRKTNTSISQVYIIDVNELRYKDLKQKIIIYLRGCIYDDLPCMNSIKNITFSDLLIDDIL